MLRFSFRENNHPLPSTKTWQVLNGLRPRHLKIVPQMDLSRLLDMMHTPWPLETVFITGEDTCERNRTIPRAFSGVQELTGTYPPLLPWIEIGIADRWRICQYERASHQRRDLFTEISHINKVLLNSI